MLLQRLQNARISDDLTGCCATIWFAVAFFGATVSFAQDECKNGRVEEVFVESVNDSTNVTVKLKYDEAETPQYYFCHLNTGVCEDGLCKPLVIDVFWDLLGNFLKYEVPEGEPLTKMDHMEFTEEDHEKLRSILARKTSILKDYPLKDLFVKPKGSRSDKVDAVTAATRVDVKEEVVGGAVYSTYVLWHVVNGPIASKVADHAKPFLTEERVSRMFYSDNLYYQYFALNPPAVRDSTQYVDGVVHLVVNGKDYIPYFAIEKVPPSAWRQEKYQVLLLEHFGGADFEMQNAMLGHMRGVRLAPRALSLLVASLERITDKQMSKVLDIIAANRDRLDDQSRKKLSRLTRHDNSEIAGRVTAILEKKR